MRIERRLRQQIEALVRTLHTHVHARSIWLDPLGALWDAEPGDEDLDALGHRYIGTFCRPTAAQLSRAMAGIALPRVGCLHVA
jgi:hypothetical protein